MWALYMAGLVGRARRFFTLGPLSSCCVVGDCAMRRKASLTVATSLQRCVNASSSFFCSAWNGKCVCA